MNDLLDRLRAVWEGFSPRERVLISFAGAFLAGLLVWLALVTPVLSSRDRARQRVVVAEQELAVMLRLRQEFDEVNARLSAVERRIQNGPQGNIFTVLETLARRSAVKVEAMEPQAALASERYRETKVQVVLKSVTLAQAVSYLHQIESSEQLLSVKSLRLRIRRDQPEFMDVTFTVSSFEPVS